MAEAEGSRDEEECQGGEWRKRECMPSSQETGSSVHVCFSLQVSSLRPLASLSHVLTNHSEEEKE